MLLQRFLLAGAMPAISACSAPLADSQVCAAGKDAGIRIRYEARITDGLTLTMSAEEARRRFGGLVGFKRVEVLLQGGRSKRVSYGNRLEMGMEDQPDGSAKLRVTVQPSEVVELDLGRTHARFDVAQREGGTWTGETAGGAGQVARTVPGWGDGAPHAEDATDRLVAGVPCVTGRYALPTGGSMERCVADIDGTPVVLTAEWRALMPNQGKQWLRAVAIDRDVCVDADAFDVPAWVRQNS